MPSEATSDTLTLRFTPETSTLAMEEVSSTISTTWPGIPRHMFCSLHRPETRPRSLSTSEPCRGYGCLPQTQPAIIGRHTLIHIDVKIRLLKPGHQLFQQEPVLKAAPAERDGIQPGLLSRAAACLRQQEGNGPVETPRNLRDADVLLQIGNDAANQWSHIQSGRRPRFNRKW